MGVIGTSTRYRLALLLVLGVAAPAMLVSVSHMMVLWRRPVVDKDLYGSIYGSIYDSELEGEIMLQGPYEVH